MSGVELSLGAIALVFPLVDSFKRCNRAFTNYREFDQDLEHLILKLESEQRHCRFRWEQLLLLFVKYSDVTPMLTNQHHQRWNDKDFLKHFNAVLREDKDVLVSTRISQVLVEVTTILNDQTAVSFPKIASYVPLFTLTANIFVCPQLQKNAWKWITGTKTKIETCIEEIKNYSAQIRGIYLRANHKIQNQPPAAPSEPSRSLSCLLERRHQWQTLNAIVSRHHSCPHSPRHSFQWPLEPPRNSSSSHCFPSMKLAFVNLKNSTGHCNVAPEWRELAFEKGSSSPSSYVREPCIGFRNLYALMGFLSDVGYRESVQ